MSKRTKVAVYAALILLYAFIWRDGGTVGHVIALVAVAATLLFLCLHYGFSRAPVKPENADKKPESTE